MAEPIGEYLCKQCGKMPIDNPSAVVITFPEGLKLPIAEIKCHGCGSKVRSELTWEDAILFDQAGVTVRGFSFVRGPALTQEEIDSFIANFDREVERFLDICSRK